jgi:hypothetical protein
MGGFLFRSLREQVCDSDARLGLGQCDIESSAGQVHARVVRRIGRQFVEVSIDEFDLSVLKEAQVIESTIVTSGPSPPARNGTGLPSMRHWGGAFPVDRGQDFDPRFGCSESELKQRSRSTLRVARIASVPAPQHSF